MLRPNTEGGPDHRTAFKIKMPQLVTAGHLVRRDRRHGLLGPRRDPHPDHRAAADHHQNHHRRRPHRRRRRPGPG